MMKVTDQAVRAALDNCLSGMETLPSVRADVLKQIGGEQKMKKKISIGMVLVLALALLTVGAMAAGLGLFGQLGSLDYTDARLSGLERVAENISQRFVTAEGVAVTIDQAYYDGSRVFISYTMSGPFDQVELGEGKPENPGECDWELPGEVYGQSFAMDGPNHQALMTHLDGSAPRWAKTSSVSIHDGLQIGEEYLDIIGGESYWTEEGTLVGWKECMVPETLAADEVTFLLGTFPGQTTYYQDETGLYVYFGERQATTWHPFTVKKDTTGGQKLTGTVSGTDWAARAALTASAIDIKGEIAVECPASWVEIQRTWENPDGIDCIQDWNLYAGGEKVDDWVVEGIHPGSDTGLVFDILCKLDDAAVELKLAPVFSQSGEHLDEAIVLQVE